MNNQYKNQNGNYNYPLQNAYYQSQQPYQQHAQYSHELQNMNPQQQQYNQNLQNYQLYPQNYQNQQAQQLFSNPPNQLNNSNYQDFNINNSSIYDSQFLNQLSQSSLDLEIQKNDAKIKLLKNENQNLNQEIQQLNHQKQQQHQQNQLPNNGQFRSEYGQVQSNQAQMQPNNIQMQPNYNINVPNNVVLMGNHNQMMFNNFPSSNTEYPEIIYCTASFHSRRKHFLYGIGNQDLLNALQQIHNSLVLDFSRINIIGRANLFKQSFVQKEIIEPLVDQNRYIPQKAIEDSKSVYCCNNLQKQLLKYALPVLIFSIIWVLGLAVTYIVNSLGKQSNRSTLNLIVEIFQISYLSIEIFLCYYTISRCSFKTVQILILLSFLGIFVNFFATSATMIHQSRQLTLFAYNVLTMFLSLFFCIITQVLNQCLKRICAVVKQISSAELVE